MKKVFLVLNIFIVGGLSSMMFLGCSDSTEEIKIGVAGPHSGDLAPYGIPTLEAAQIIADNVNADGGIKGRNIVVVSADDLCDPAQATTVASKLVADGVVAVVGHVCSGATISAMETYMNAEIPVISPSSTAPALTKSGNYTGFYRTIAPDDLQGIIQANFLIDKLNVQNVAVIHDQQDYGKGLADSTKSVLEASGINIPVYEGIAVNAVDYSAIVTKIISENVDAVVFGGYHPEGSKLVGQLKARGFDGIFISGDGLKADDFINIAGAAAEGVYATGAKDYTSNPIYLSALAEYKKKKSAKPGAFYFEGYSAFTVIIEAIKAGNTTSEDIQKYLSSGQKFDTPVGQISFDEKGDAEGTGFDVYQVKNGNFVVAQ